MQNPFRIVVDVTGGAPAVGRRRPPRRPRRRRSGPAPRSRNRRRLPRRHAPPVAHRRARVGRPVGARSRLLALHARAGTGAHPAAGVHAAETPPTPAAPALPPPDCRRRPHPPRPSPARPRTPAPAATAAAKPAPRPARGARPARRFPRRRHARTRRQAVAGAAARPGRAPRGHRRRPRRARPRGDRYRRPPGEGRDARSGAARARDPAGGRLRDGAHPRPGRLPAARGAHGAREHRPRRSLPLAALQRERRRQTQRRRDLFPQPRLERALDADRRPREQHGRRQHERPAADRPGDPELQDGRVEPVRREGSALPARHPAPQVPRHQEPRRQAGALLRADRRADAQHPRRGLLHQPPEGRPATRRPGLPPADRAGARRRRETLRPDGQDRSPRNSPGGRPHEHAPPDRAHAQHRHHRAHRRRQDHGQRALPLLLRPQPQDGRGPRRRGDDGLDAPGAGARDHDHRRGDDLRLARAPGQPHRHAGPRGLHDRGRAFAARSRRRRGRLLRRRRGAAADRDRLAPGRALARADHLFRQQARPRRRRLRCRRLRDRVASSVPCRSPCSCRSASRRSSGA